MAGYPITGDDLKALQVSMIGVYLRPNDAHEWHRLASWSLDLGNREQALLCFKRAVKAEPENAEFYLEIVTLASELGNHRDCFRYGTSVIPRFAENQAQMCIQLSRTIAQIQYKYGKVNYFVIIAKAISIYYAIIELHVKVFSNYQAIKVFSRY